MPNKNKSTPKRGKNAKPTKISGLDLVVVGVTLVFITSLAFLVALMASVVFMFRRD